MIRKVYPASRDAWLAGHATVIGASEFAALVGADPRHSYFEVFARKTNRLEPPRETPAMRRGLILEGTALDMVRAEHPDWQIEHNLPGDGGVFFVDDEHRICATPDAFVYDPKRGHGILEVKTVTPGRFKDHWYLGDTITPPEGVTLQVGIGADLALAQWCAVVALRVAYEIELDVIEVPLLQPRMLKQVHERVAEFWGFVARDELPPPDYGRDGKLISKLFPQDDGTQISIDDPVFAEMLVDRARLKADEKQVGAELDRIDAAIRHRMGNAAIAVAGDWLIKLKTYERAGYTVLPSTARRLIVDMRRKPRELVA